MDFGIWVEPEMVNRESNLFRLHPEWTYHFPTRQSSESRNQLVLNLAIPAVEEFILRILDNVLHQNDIAFVKWDFNRNISEPGWPDAPKGREKEVWVRHVQAFYRIVETLRERHPQVSFEACAGGGARVDLGTLSRFDQFWPSDNTDPLDRLLIQDGYSYAYCAKAMMSWVTDSPNFVNGRATPLSFRFAVAMMGSLGIGCDLNRLSREEVEECAHWIARYKQIRETVQEGDLYRLHSPRYGPIAATQYVTRDGRHSVLFVTLTGGHFAHELPVVRLCGLKEEARYSVEGFAEPKSGAYLMHLGIRFRLRGGDYQSVVCEVARLD
jgi:alpha-galactosidase